MHLRFIFVDFKIRLDIITPPESLHEVFVVGDDDQLKVFLLASVVDDSSYSKK